MSEKTAAYWYQQFAEDVAEVGYVDATRYEVRLLGDFWRTPEKDTLLRVAEQRPDLVRHKPSSITIRGPGGEYSYPEPVREALRNGTRYFVPLLWQEGTPLSFTWHNDTADYAHLRRGRVHLDEVAARAHAAAEIRVAGFEP